MPNRILREGILTSPRIAKLGWSEEVFYRRLMSVVDDFGRYYADEGMLRAACYPRQLNKVSDSDVGKWLRACADAALVRVYPAQDGERYLEVLNFGQQVRAKKSKFPDMHSTCVADAEQVQASARLDVSVSEDVKAAAQPLVLPDWLPKPAWHGFVEMRKKVRKPMTDRAMELMLAKLQKFRDDGYDVAAILENSTASSWTDLYEPKGGAKPAPSGLFAGAV